MNILKKTVYILKRTLVLLCSLLILALFLASLLFLSVNHDKTFLKIASALLASRSVHIQSTSGINVSPFLFSFEEIKINYQEHDIVLYNGRLSAELLSKKYLLKSLEINKIDIHLNNTKNKDGKISADEPFDLLTLSPKNIFNNYPGLNINVDDLSVKGLAFSEEEIVAKNIKINNEEEKLSLKLNLLLTDDSNLQAIPVHLDIYQKDYLGVSIQLADSEKVNGKIDISGNSIKSELSGTLKQESTQYLKNLLASINIDNIDWINSINHIEGDFRINSDHVITDNHLYLKGNDLLNTIKYAAIAVKGDVILKNSLMKKLNIDLNIVTDNLSNPESAPKSTTESKKNKEFNFTVEKMELMASINKKREPLNDSETINRLLLNPLKLSVKSGSKAFFKKGKFSFNNIRINIAETYDPEFFKLDINRLNGSYSKDNKKEDATSLSLDIEYTSNTQWNKHLSSKHDGNVSINKTHNSIKIKSYVSDHKLHAKLHSDIEIKNNVLLANYKLIVNEFYNKNKAINKIIAYWNKDIKLLDGEIDLSGSLKFPIKSKKSNINYNFILDMNKLQIDYDDYIIRNLNFSAPFSGNNTVLKNTHPFEINIKEIDAGFPISNISLQANTQLDFDGDSLIDFYHFKSHLLAGTATSDFFTIKLPDSKSNENQQYNSNIDIALKDINLKAILSLIDNPEIQGEGILFGKMPLHIDQDSYSINQGWVKNSKPGTIQYKPDKASIKALKEKPQMKLLLDVLGHLDYKELNAELDLNRLGSMEIKGHLKGVNPDYKEGYPIIFNPNITLNFNDMMQSLRISQSVGDSITDRINEKALQ